MTAKPVVPRAQARRDVENAIDHYVGEAGEQVAAGFIVDLEHAYLAISRHPASGSPRYDHELNLPGLRRHMLSRYPYIVFYIERDDRIDVWRVLHAQRDVPASIRAE